MKYMRKSTLFRIRIVRSYNDQVQFAFGWFSLVGQNTQTTGFQYNRPGVHWLIFAFIPRNQPSAKIFSWNECSFGFWVNSFRFSVTNWINSIFIKYSRKWKWDVLWAVHLKSSSFSIWAIALKWILYSISEWSFQRKNIIHRWNEHWARAFNVNFRWCKWIKRKLLAQRLRFNVK